MGTCPPPPRPLIFTVGQQSMRNSGKTSKFRNKYVLKKILYLCENYVMFGENLLICPAKFSYVIRKVSGTSGKCFWYVRKIFLVTSPTTLGRNINVQVPCSGKLHCAPQTRLGPYAHAYSSLLQHFS